MFSFFSSLFNFAFTLDLLYFVNEFALSIQESISWAYKYKLIYTLNQKTNKSYVYIECIIIIIFIDSV